MSSLLVRESMPSHTDSNPVLRASALIEQRTGLSAMQFRAELESILATLADGKVEAYVTRLERGHETDPSWQMLINALTIGETYFFRDPAHFRLLKSHVLPALVMKRRQQAQLTLNLWSVGCATGEEPYSLAIALQEFLPDLPAWTLRLIATDLNAHALELARRGIYRKWAFRQPPASNDGFQNTYFEKTEFGLQLKRYLREMVTFRPMNLLSGPPLPQLDIILCRNVLIYFKSAQVEYVEDLLYDALLPGGWLMLGQSEAIRFKRERWITHLFPGSAIYQKPLEQVKVPPGQFAYQQHAQPAIEITATDEVPVVRAVTYEDAVRALREDQSELAERHLNEILTYQPDHPSAHMLLATVLASRRALPEARAHIDTALRIDPLQADAHYLRAMLHLEESRVEEARRSLNAALYCQRNHPLAAYMLGNLCAQSGDITRANKLWENARKAISNLLPESPISDISDMTAGRLLALVSAQLNDWKS